VYFEALEVLKLRVIGDVVAYELDCVQVLISLEVLELPAIEAIVIQFDTLYAFDVREVLERADIGIGETEDLNVGELLEIATIVIRDACTQVLIVKHERVELSGNDLFALGGHFLDELSK